MISSIFLGTRLRGLCIQALYLCHWSLNLAYVCICAVSHNFNSVIISCHPSCCRVSLFFSVKLRNVLASFGWIIRFGSVMAIDCTNSQNQKVQCSSDIAELWLGNGFVFVGCFLRVSATPRWFQLSWYQCLCLSAAVSLSDAFESPCERSSFVKETSFDACEIIRRRV